MSASVQTSSLAAPAARMKSKPYSLEGRFRLMQAGTLGFSLLLVSFLLYWSLAIQQRLTASLGSLHTMLDLNTQIHAAHEGVTQSFWQAYYSDSVDLRPDYRAHANELRGRLRGYGSLFLTDLEQSEVQELRRREEGFLDGTQRLLEGARNAQEDEAQLREVERASWQVETNLRRLSELQIRELGALNSRIGVSGELISLVLIFLAVLTYLAIAWFQRAHRQHLWGPLENLREMVGEVRRGNLDVTGQIPDDIELGSLVGAFLEMAGALREMRDQLEQKVIERTAKLEATQKELLQAAKLASLGELVSGVAHEINNPLTSILGFSEIVLSRTELSAEVRDPVLTVRNEALRLRSLVANLTSFARRAPHRTQRMDLKSILGRLFELRHYQLHANNISLHVERPEEPAWVMADPDQLLQVLLNLVLNSEQAIKEIRERGDIWIACGSKNDQAWLTVRDNGAGMDDTVRPHIFDPFFTTKSTGQSTGLGLSISHGIIEQHHGRITVESELRQGTTMRITLPMAPQPSEKESSGKTIPARPAAVSKRIWRALVIDDEEDILEMIRQALERLNCRATLMVGAEGLEAAIAEGQYDLVICDLKMPGKNGLEVLRLIREKRPELARRFLLMTGNLRDADEHADELAAVSLLPKPFTLARLREAAEELLDRDS